jgi:hypothetical protein
MVDRRDEFLLEMYRQMFNDINRHIMVVWQLIGVLVGAFAIFALVGKDILSLDMAVTVIILLCAWLCAHLIDASYWYNRNLVIIANIERLFLHASDLKDVHNYFGKHRTNNKMIMHLRIQGAFGIVLAALVLSFHFYSRVYDGLTSTASSFEFIRILPYLMAVCTIIYGFYLWNERNKKYAEFIKESPGTSLDINRL